jgi:SAM-dependent methyltransferase
MPEPKLYGEHSEWWPLFSAPEDYSIEAAFFSDVLRGATEPPPRTVLELGSGGGNNAVHMKAHFELTLADLAPGMVEVSRRLNPECGHVVGDMRTLRLDKQYDAIFVHDAVMYMITEDDLHAAMTTAFVHTRPGGVALFAPDFFKETFAPETEHGGHDGDYRGLRYLLWLHDPDPDDTVVIEDFVLAFRNAFGAVTVEHDRHLNGLFPRATWLGLLARVGFTTTTVVDPYQRELLLARRPFRLEGQAR